MRTDVEYTDEQIRKTTQRNLEQHSGRGHSLMELFQMAEDCPHTSPADDPKYDGLDDLLDEWMARNCPGLTFPNFIGSWGRFRVEADLYHRNRNRGMAIVPGYWDYVQAEWQYDEQHGNVCLLSPMGTCCEGCAEGDEDSGFEPGNCHRQQRAKEDQDEFFWLFSDDNRPQVRFA